MIIKNRKYPLLTEQELRLFLLNESMHYPDFLDSITEGLYKEVYNIVRFVIKSKLSNYEELVPYNCDYFDSVDFKINVINKPEIKSYGYFSNENVLKDGKLNNPSIQFVLNRYDCNAMYDSIPIILSHEVNHLYDEWQRLICGKLSLNQREDLIISSDLVEKFGKSGDKILSSISWLLYMSSYTEKNSFLYQCVEELKQLKCDRRNYHGKMKQTNGYKNVTEAFNELKEEVMFADNFRIRYVNNLFLKFKGKISVPSYPPQSFDVQNYKAKLLNWASNVKDKYLTDYYSVVAYYLDNIADKIKSDFYVK